MRGRKSGWGEGRMSGEGQGQEARVRGKGWEEAQEAEGGQEALEG